MKDLYDLEKAFENGLNAWEKQICKKHARVMGMKLVRECKRLTPVDTGNLRRRWKYRVDMEKGEIMVWITNDAEYAPYVNYGHRVVRAKKTVGMKQGVHMLEKGMETYQTTYMKSDIEEMIDDLRKNIK